MGLLSTSLQTSFAALLLWFAISPNIMPMQAMFQPDRGEGYWHTSGNKILDASGHPVRIAGVNWYGFETANSAPGGLNLQDYKVVLETIHKSGYNTIRIPFSSQMIESPSVPTSIQFSNRDGRINTDLKGLDSFQVLDKIISAAGSAGLKVILDNHRSKAGDGPEANGLWFTPAYPETSWIADWQMLARRYKNNPTVIGFDLRNEPHNANSGGACWGCGGDHDWHLAAERAGNAVLAVNSKLLIFVEGVDAYEDDFYWWGGNLEGVATTPVRLSVPHQLVYSAHDYGPAESGQPWFTSATTAATLRAVWTSHWAYISDRNIAPVWLGEFGAQKRDLGAPTAAGDMEAQWFQSLVQFLNDNPRLSWTYWALNGDDRYGLLNGNYEESWDNDKQQALAAVQFPLSISSEKSAASLIEVSRVNTETTIAPVPSEPANAQTSYQQAPQPRTGDTTTIIPVPSHSESEIGCHVSYSDQKDWGKGFTGALTIQNTGSAPIEGWTLTWSYDGTQHLAESWGGNFRQQGNDVSLVNANWNVEIPPRSTLAGIGFNAGYTGRNAIPTRFFLNGHMCT